jgi:uncharacterized protein
MIVPMASATLSRIIEQLGLVPHPEGGYFTETWRAPAARGERGAGTSIYFLLGADQVSQWHRVDATEIWHYYAGAPIELALSPDAVSIERCVLGNDLAIGHRPQLVIPPLVWQSARSLGEFTLVGCTVSPAFEFTGFELAPPGWAPTG